MNLKKIISAVSAGVLAASISVSAFADESTWTSNFNGTASEQKLNTIFGEVTAIGKTGETAKNAGLNGCVASAGSLATKVSNNGIYAVKIQSDGSDTNYALAVYNTKATLTSNEFKISTNDEFTMSYITYACYKTTGTTTTVRLKNGDTELISYTYDASTGKVTGIMIGGKTPTGFEAFSAVSVTSGNSTVVALSDVHINNDYNTQISVSIKGNGEASISFKRNTAKYGVIDKTFTGTVKGCTSITAFEIVSQADDASRMYAIDDLTTKLIKGEVIKPAEKYTYINDDNLSDKDAVGFIATIGGLSGKVVNSLTWYIKKADTEYKELTSGTIPTVTGEGEAKIGLIVYDLPTGVAAEDISAGYTYTSSVQTVE